jgi:MinD-like ATPase involved in chromosome partitioning or flagellar assembly
MYTVTFYSFKGGVGRSLALANVGSHLALTGRKVLLVDFDLEAPGLDTFNQFEPPKNSKGVIDFIYDYIQTGKSPLAEEYAYNCAAFSENGGSLWVMPAGGNSQPCYSRRFAAIDWQKLYSDHDGYLLLEELKSQWEHLLKFDYVLVDSRTGYTDVAGICTRQLPDAVVILFFPNEQNLGGLEEIVAGVREETTGPSNKQIQLHFVTSNVPDLDDEDHILARRMDRFKRRLGYSELAGIIHHYPSLALLNQVIFIQKRPRSRLAKEYRGLCRQILRYNLQDREGALSFLRTPREPDSIDRAQNLDGVLEEIRRYHDADAEVLGQLGSVYSQLGRSDAALNLYEQAIKKGFKNARLLLDQARIQVENGQQEAAVANAESSLTLPNVQIFEVNSAVRLLLKLNPERLRTLPLSAAFNSLPPHERLSIIRELFSNRQLLNSAEVAIRQLMVEGNISSERAECTTSLVICLIGQRKFDEAMEAIVKGTLAPDTMIVEDAFNYGMASWGRTGKLQREFFNRVVECDMNDRLETNPNLLQCSALAYWVIGNFDEAMKRLRDARAMIESRPQFDFSAWRYLQVSPREFRKDLDEMETMFLGAPVLPEILSPSSE